MAAVTVIHYRGKDDSRDNKLTVEVQEKKKKVMTVAQIVRNAQNLDHFEGEIETKMISYESVWTEKVKNNT